MLAVIIGGAASGKSEYAERLACHLSGGEGLIYLATMLSRDEESNQRICRHRQLRMGKGFQTVECPLHLSQLQLPKKQIVLLECLTNLVANERFEQNGGGKDTVREVLCGIKYLCNNSKHVVVVTGNLFDDGITYSQETQQYCQDLSQIHQQLCRQADYVAEVVYSIPVVYKGKHYNFLQEEGSR